MTKHPNVFLFVLYKHVIEAISIAFRSCKSQSTHLPGPVEMFSNSPSVCGPTVILFYYFLCV